MNANNLVGYIVSHTLYMVPIAINHTTMHEILFADG